MQRLKAWRLRRGLTQSALAQQLGVDQRQVARWERSTLLPRPSTLQRMAAVLDASVDELLTADELGLPADDPTIRLDRQAAPARR